MIFSLALFAASLLRTFAATTPLPASLSIDLDGSGKMQTVSARPHGKSVRVEVRADSGGKVLASADAPAPAAGATDLVLTSGSLGSAGSLLEVVAASVSEECHSVWRFRDRALSRIALKGPGVSAPDCGPRRDWTWTWDRPSDDAPAELRRERTSSTPEGPFRRVESFRWAGFGLELDLARSRSEVRGVAIPSWFSARLYKKSTLSGLYSRLDLSALKTSPWIQLLTDPGSGVFALRVDRSPDPLVLPVTASMKGSEKSEVLLTMGSETPPRQARVTFPSGASAPSEAILSGFGRDLDGPYGAATRIADGALRVFATADDELAVIGLLGTWTGVRAEPMAIALASSDPILVGIGKTQYRVDVQGAPEGFDAILLPRNGSPPIGVVLKGPNAIERVPMRCEDAPAAVRVCRASGPGEILHRVGARMNAR